jgi:hypothetical protein
MIVKPTVTAVENKSAPGDRWYAGPTVIAVLFAFMAVTDIASLPA